LWWIEAKSIGADVILLIAAALEPKAVLSFTTLAHSLGLEVLLEVHNETELLANVQSGANLLGVNNRNLKTFAFNNEISKQLAGLIPNEMIKVSESGIDEVATVLELKHYGYQGFLMGQKFMEQEKPGEACRKFIAELRKPK
jgi:indole-3-glycerol phosphate synthase